MLVDSHYDMGLGFRAEGSARDCVRMPTATFRRLLNLSRHRHAIPPQGTPLLLGSRSQLYSRSVCAALFAWQLTAGQVLS